MKALLLQITAIGVAGLLGAIARYLVSTLLARPGFRFPIGTFVINISGSFFLGWFMTYASQRQISDLWKIGIAVGFVGAYTTFSTFMYESVMLIGQNAQTEAILNLVGSVLVGLVAVKLGIVVAHMM